MSSCELCNQSIDKNSEEAISYYDLCDVGLALGNSVTLPLDQTDISIVIPGCTSIPDPEYEAGTNLATWKVCSDCHSRIRGKLGRSEYPPQNY